jgi:hypothetical protein
LKRFPVGTKNIDFSCVSTFGSILIESVSGSRPFGENGAGFRSRLYNQKLKNCSVEKKYVQYNFYDKKLLQNKPEALQRNHSALQNMKFLHFFLFWTIFSWLDTDPNSKCGYETLISTPLTMSMQKRN